MVAPASMATSQTFDEEVGVGAGGVFGGELDVVGVGAGEGDHGGDLVEGLGAGDLELGGQVEVGGGEEGVDAAAVGGLDGAGGGFDVFALGAGEGGDDGAGGGADLRGRWSRMAGGVAFGGDGEAGFEDVDAERGELVGHAELFGVVHGAAGGLLAVAEGGVEDERRWAGSGGTGGLMAGSGELMNIGLGCC